MGVPMGPLAFASLVFLIKSDKCLLYKSQYRVFAISKPHRFRSPERDCPQRSTIPYDFAFNACNILLFVWGFFHPN